jgi:hypothetical protein
MVLLRCVAILSHLHHVKAELCFQVRRLILGIQNELAKLRPQLWILNAYRLIHCRVASDIGRVVGQRPQGERILVYILALQQKLANEISGSNVMSQVAEFLAAEGVVTQVLNDRATVCVGVRFLDLIVGQSGITLEQERPDLIGPEQVHNFLVG